MSDTVTLTMAKSPLAGYRTLAFALIVAVAGVFGHHLSPDLVNNYLDAIFPAIAAGIMVLRFVTTTPVFSQVIPVPVMALAREIVAAVPVGEAATNADPAQGQVPLTPASGAESPTGPPTDLVKLATSISSALITVQTIHAQMTQAMQAAHESVSAALPVGVVQAPDPAPVPQAAPQPIEPAPQPQAPVPVAQAPQPEPQPQPQPEPASNPQPQPQI